MQDLPYCLAKAVKSRARISFFFQSNIHWQISNEGIFHHVIPEFIKSRSTTSAQLSAYTH